MPGPEKPKMPHVYQIKRVDRPDSCIDIAHEHEARKMFENLASTFPGRGYTLRIAYYRWLTEET